MTSSLWQPFVSGVVDSSRSVIHVLYTISCNVPTCCYIIGFSPNENGGHSWGGINSGVSFCNNSVEAGPQWAFQVSQGSVEALFRWGGKRLNHFAANLFRKRYTKFHQNRPSFIGDITKKSFWSLFSGHGVYIINSNHNNNINNINSNSIISDNGISISTNKIAWASTFEGVLLLWTRPLSTS